MSSKAKNRFLCSAVSVTLALCVFMFMLCAFSFNAHAADTDTLVTISDLNLRKTASTSGTVLATIPEGTSVTLLQDSTNGWAKVKYSTYTGYCSTTYLNKASGSSVAMKGKTTDDVNMRSGKGTSYSVLTVIPSGTTVTVSSNADEDWAKVTYSSKSGYVSKDYLTVTFTLATVTETQSATQQTTAATVAETVAPTVSYTYSYPDYSQLPHWYAYSITDSLLKKDNTAFSKLMLDKADLSLDINETYTLTAFVTGATPVLEHISYKSSNSSVASVSTAGVVTGKASGIATITATDLATQKTATCKVTVGSGVLATEPAATAPTTAPTSAPTTASTTAPTTSTETLSLSATSATLYVGNQYILIATSNSSVTWSTSKSSVATVSDGVVTAKAAGTAVITAKTSTKSVTCTITVKTASATVDISATSATVTAGKTYLAYSSTSSVKWTSSDTSVATVNNGYILGVSPGKAIIKVYKSGGAQTMLVTVTDAAPIRFAYTSPNCATKNSDVTLIAITDNTRTAVKFNVTVGSETQTVTASSKTTDGSNYIWKGTISFDTAGTYTVKAYSKLGSKWSTCDDASTTAFVTSTTDKTTTVCANRRASDEIINLIANYEGFIGSVYDDPLTGDPTVGYGRVVYSGQQFYNNLSKTEAYAYLVQTVNNDGYATKVNQFLVNNSVKFNQQQFDALVCFVYNTGTGVLSNDDELTGALLDCSTGSTGTKTYYINGDAVRIRTSPTTADDSTIIKELDYGTTLTILEKTSTTWYYVKLSDGTKGYVYSTYISSKVASGSLDLDYVTKQTLINKFCQYHHANGCVYGLLYRRVDEMEVFFYNDYDRNYGEYKYNISFTCANNSDFHT